MSESTPPLFHAPPELWEIDEISLPESEAHHARRVLRLPRGSLVIVIDGHGRACRGELVPRGRGASVRPLGELRNYGEPSVRLTLAAGLSAGHKFDITVEKATELGVRRIVPLVCAKSKVKLTDSRRASARITRLERVALAAAKQCRRAYRPDIALPLGLQEFLDGSDADDLKLIFVTGRRGETLSEMLTRGSVSRVTLLVGPESGLTAEEVDAALEAGYHPVTLGDRILRTETAGPIACALVMYELGELR